MNYRQELDLYTAGKPYLIFYKLPRFRPVQSFCDVLNGSGQEKQYHPWQQTLAESRQFIRWFTRPGQIILDPCVGSGTTLLAAHLEGRQAIGVEIERETYEKARARLVKEGVEVADWPAK